MLIPCVVITAMLAGMLIGARFVPPDAGLAAGATVLFYGIVGMLIGVMVVVVLARRLSASAIRKAALGAVVVCIAVIALVTWQFLDRQREVERRSRIASPKI